MYPSKTGQNYYFFGVLPSFRKAKIALRDGFVSIAYRFAYKFIVYCVNPHILQEEEARLAWIDKCRACGWLQNVETGIMHGGACGVAARCDG